MTVTDVGTEQGAPMDARSGESEGGRTQPPSLPMLGKATGGDAGAALRAARVFYRGGGISADDLPVPSDDVLPALLHEYRDPSLVRHDYPLVLLPPGADRAVIPLSDLFKDQISSFAPGADESRTLKDNVRRLERAVRRELDGHEEPAELEGILLRAADAVEKELSLSPDHAGKLHADLKKLVVLQPEHTLVLGLSERSAQHLLVHAARHRGEMDRAGFRRRVASVCDELRGMLRVDRQKQGRRDPEALARSVASSETSYVDPDRLATVLGQMRGSKPMAADRRERIERVLGVLERYLTSAGEAVLTLVHDGSMPKGWSSVGPVRLVQDADPCAAALRDFDKTAQSHAELFASVRVAELEARDQYTTELHDPFVASFDWEEFSQEELRVLPGVVAVERMDRVCTTGLASLSRVLLSGRPVRVLALVEPAANPGASGDDPLAGFHFELGYVGIGHREAEVHQSSAARPDHLVGGFLAMLASARASLHVVSTGLCIGGSRAAVGEWLHAGAALEGRAHAFFRYDPEAGGTWASRFDFSGNAQAESDWPVYELKHQDADGSARTMPISFTFADFALLESAYREHFRVLPEGCVSDDLTPLAECLSRDPDEMIRQIPFIWAVDGAGRLVRVAVSRRLVFACRDRLAYWHTLQELAGINNTYVKEAVARAEAALQSTHEAKVRQFKEEHARELDRVRASAAQDALGRLAKSLMGMDPAKLSEAVPVSRAAAPAPAPAASPGTTAPGPETAPPAVEEEEEEGGFDEPFIDSVLCTSCNDCLNLNPQMFVYNENKQAKIADASAGTFAQLVAAAEKCPARCIHPGKPRNPDEQNLAELIERAKPFN